MSARVESDSAKLAQWLSTATGRPWTPTPQHNPRATGTAADGAPLEVTVYRVKSGRMVCLADVWSGVHGYEESTAFVGRNWHKAVAATVSTSLLASPRLSFHNAEPMRAALEKVTGEAWESVVPMAPNDWGWTRVRDGLRVTIDTNWRAATINGVSIKIPPWSQGFDARARPVWQHLYPADYARQEREKQAKRAADWQKVADALLGRAPIRNPIPERDRRRMDVYRESLRREDSGHTPAEREQIRANLEKLEAQYGSDR